MNFLRTQLATVQGATVPAPYGGKQRQIMVNISPQLLQSRGLSANDVVNTLSQQALVLPGGTAKIGRFEYNVDLNAMPNTVPETNDLPIPVVGTSPTSLTDVPQPSDRFPPQPPTI